MPAKGKTRSRPLLGTFVEITLDDASPAEAMQRDNKLVYHAQKAVSDPYSLSVRELFGERILFRHSHDRLRNSRGILGRPRPPQPLSQVQ